MKISWKLVFVGVKIAKNRMEKRSSLFPVNKARLWSLSMTSPFSRTKFDVIGHHEQHNYRYTVAR